MNQILKLKLDPQVFTAIQQQAEAIGISTELLAANLLKKQFEQTFQQIINESENQVARERFERHFGEISLGCDININNESIDADLAMEYICNHIDNK
jgi:hypothetical protein